MRDFVAALNHFYLAHAALWEQDFSQQGFSWIDVDRADDNMVSYVRRAENGEELLVVISFCGADMDDYALHVPSAGVYDVVFSTCAWRATEEMSYAAVGEDGENRVHLRLPACTAIILARRTEGIALALKGE